MRVLRVLLCIMPSLLYSVDWSLETRAGYFLPAAKIMRQVYKGGGFEPEIEGGIRVYKQLKAWANFNVFIRSGHSEGLGDYTSIQLYPLSSGLKYDIQLLKDFDLYLGVGPSFTWAKIHDNSPYVQQKTNKTAWGIVGKSGFIYRFLPHGFFDLFADYSYGKIGSVSDPEVESEALNIGGLRAGLGIGIAF